MKKVVLGTLVGVSLIAVSAVGVGVWYWYRVQQAPEVGSHTSGAVSLGGGAPDQQTSEGSDVKIQMNGQSVAPAGTVAGEQSQHTETGAPQSGGSASQPTPQTQQPGPTAFGQYEQYKNDDNVHFIDERVGTGAVAGTDSKVSVDYRGWLTSGQTFDESYSRGQAFVFVIGRGAVIAGWDAGVKGMKVGGKRRLIIPAKFGYGSAGQGSIPPNAMLIFDVELRKIE